MTPSFRRGRWSVTRFLLAVFLVVGVSSQRAEGAPREAPAPICRQVTKTVSVQGVGEQQLGGTLCRPAGVATATVHLLLSGGTYNSVYWDYPYRPERYSYVRYATAQGDATLALDRLGVGASDRPPGTLLTPQMQAEAIHQVVQGLRAGTIGAATVERVVLVGHSYGSILALLEAGTYRDVDAVIVTGLLHWWNPTFLPTFAAHSHPAMFDPKYSGDLQDPAYITTQPGARQRLFYGPDPEPEIVALDEATKDLIGMTEAAIAVGLVYRDKAHAINAPVLVAVGTQDAAFCGPGATDCSSTRSVLERERPYYRVSPRLDAFVLPGSGHDLNLSRDARTFFVAAEQWLSRVEDDGALTR
jgi:pimeloyl-ACP methyl ester carboxylesterase